MGEFTGVSPHNPDFEPVAWSFRFHAHGPLSIWNWEDGPPDPKRLWSVRRPQSSALSRHVPARAHCLTTGSVLHLESGLEHELAKQLDRDQTVAWMVAQPCRLEWRSDGQNRSHTLDILSVDTAGAVTLWDVRPPERQDVRFMQSVEVTQAACRGVDWSYRIFGGLPQQGRINALFLQGYRDVDVAGDRGPGGSAGWVRQWHRHCGRLA
jgi:hypothetical protein